MYETSVCIFYSAIALCIDFLSVFVFFFAARERVRATSGASSQFGHERPCDGLDARCCLGLVEGRPRTGAS